MKSTKHNDPVKAGNIVYWDAEQTYPSVVRYVATPNWKDDPKTHGKRYARITTSSGMTCWHKVDDLVVAKDIRTSDRKKQIENLEKFVFEKYVQKTKDRAQRYADEMSVTVSFYFCRGRPAFLEKDTYVCLPKNPEDIEFYEEFEPRISSFFLSAIV